MQLQLQPELKQLELPNQLLLVGHGLMQLANFQTFNLPSFDQIKTRGQ
jgi:hypothetical protein